MNYRLFAPITALCLFGLVAGCSSSKPTGPVSSTEELQARFKADLPADIIELLPGKYDGPFAINHPVTLIGKGEKSAIKLSGTGPIITVHSQDVRLENLSIESGKASGDGIWFDNSTGHIENCIISTAGESCVHLSGAQTKISISKCDLTGGDAGIYAYGSAQGEVIDCQIHKVKVGILSRSKGTLVTISRSKIYDCPTNALWASSGGKLDIQECEVTGNPIAALVDPKSRIELTTSQIHHNTDGIILAELSSGYISNNSF